MPQSTFRDLCARYILYAKIQDGKSKTTVKSYQNRLRIFCDWLPDGATLDHVTIPILCDYLYHLSSKKICKTTIVGHFFPLRAVGEWLVEQKMWSNNITLSVKLPKRSEPERTRVSDETVAEMLSAAQRLYPERRAAMATLILRLLAYTGVRRQELLDIRVQDIDLRAHTLVVAHGKGDKSRTLGLHPDVRSALKQWLEHRGVCSTPFLITVDKARRLGQSGLKHLLREVETVSGHGGEHITCHPLRHNFANYSHYEANVPIRAVQKALGHSRLETTTIYTEDRPKEVIDRMRSLPNRQKEQRQASRRIVLRR